MSKKIKPLARLQRLIEVKRQDVKINQLRLHQKKAELKQQHERLKLYREEYVSKLMASNTSPLQMDDTRRFLEHLETSIDDTKKALDSQVQSEMALQEIAGKLTSQQKSVERRIDTASKDLQQADETEAVAAGGKPPYTRGTASE